MSRKIQFYTNVIFDKRQAEKCTHKSSLKDSLLLFCFLFVVKVNSNLFGEILLFDALILRWTFMFCVFSFPQIADKCHLLGNYNSLKALLAGLQCTPVYRLKESWKEVPSRRKK